MSDNVEEDVHYGKMREARQERYKANLREYIRSITTENPGRVKRNAKIAANKGTGKVTFEWIRRKRTGWNPFSNNFVRWDFTWIAFGDYMKEILEEINKECKVPGVYYEYDNGHRMYDIDDPPSIRLVVRSW